MPDHHSSYNTTPIPNMVGQPPDGHKAEVVNYILCFAHHHKSIIK